MLWILICLGTEKTYPIEGIPQHAWTKEIDDKVLCDEAIIHHIEEESLERSDQRSFNCWVFCKDPSLIPQVMYLKLATFEPDPRRQALMYSNRPRALKKRHGFKVLAHIDVVEDLLFYHYPHEELIADGKVPWRGFAWQTNRMDGELNEDELHPPTRYCGKGFQP
jgi:hypothetical protein